LQVYDPFADSLFFLDQPWVLVFHPGVHRTAHAKHRFKVGEVGRDGFARVELDLGQPESVSFHQVLDIAGIFDRDML
jgi:hypothetical protein